MSTSPPLAQPEPPASDPPNTLLQPVTRHRLHETVAARVEELIVSGAFQADEALPTEQDMALQFAVSRTVVRDAIRVLATKGLVEIRHGVGTFVTPSGRERLAEALELSLRRGDYTPWELYVVRRGLEMIVAEEAIQHATAGDLAAMRSAVASFGSAYPADPETAQREHIRFHQIMVRCTGNRILMDLLDPITVFRIPYAWGLSAARKVDHEDYVRRHTELVDALESRDLPAVRAAMLGHLTDLEDRARCAMAEQHHPS